MKRGNIAVGEPLAAPAYLHGNCITNIGYLYFCELFRYTAGGEGSLKTSLRVFRGSKRAPALRYGIVLMGRVVEGADPYHNERTKVLRLRDFIGE